MTSFPPHDVGLALSGGGSRAAGFHRGTLLALIELGLLPRVDVVSTVSGGSLFGAAWLAARSAGTDDRDYLAEMRCQLADGFILRSLRPRLLRALVPGTRYSRTDVIAETFDKAFFSGRVLSELPEHPALCINATLLNNGQVAKFSREGLSAWNLRTPGSTPSHLVPLPQFPLSRAVAASAAFPVGLPPLVLSIADLPQGVELLAELSGATRLVLTDGGVLENLGIQTLVRSRRFAAWNLVVSDAGTRQAAWNPRPFRAALRGFGIWMLSGRILDRLMLVMNDKQNRWARQEVMNQLQFSWLVDVANGNSTQPGLPAFLSTWPNRKRRGLLFVRVAQSWASFMLGVPESRLLELAAAAGQPGAPLQEGTAAREALLEAVGVDLTSARNHYAQLGGDDGAARMNQIPTNFTAIDARVLDQLAHHAAWQVHAGHAIYGL